MGGRGQPWGGVRDEGEGEVVVDEGDGDGEVQVVDPPMTPPPSPTCHRGRLQGPEDRTVPRMGYHLIAHSPLDMEEGPCGHSVHSRCGTVVVSLGLD